MITDTEITRTCRIFLQTRMFRSIDFCVLRDACRELFLPLGICFALGTQDAEVTKSLLEISELKKKISSREPDRGSHINEILENTIRSLS